MWLLKQFWLFYLMTRKNLIVIRRSWTWALFEILFPVFIGLPISFAVYQNYSDDDSDSGTMHSSMDMQFDVLNPVSPGTNGSRFYAYALSASISNATFGNLLAEFCTAAVARAMLCTLKAMPYDEIISAMRTDPNGTTYRGVLFTEVDFQQSRLSYDFLMPDDDFNASIKATWNNGEPFAHMGQPQKLYGASGERDDAVFVHSLHAAFLKIVGGTQLTAIQVLPAYDNSLEYRFWMDAPSWQSVIIAICALPTMLHLAREIAAEKESGMKDFLAIMGMGRGVFLTSHIFIGWLKTTIIMLALMANPVAFMTGNSHWYISPTYIFLPVTIYSLACMICAAAVACIFTNSNSAIKVVVIVHCALIALFIIPPLQPSIYNPWLATLSSLNYNAAYGYSLVAVRTYLLRNRALRPNTAFEDTADFLNAGPATLLIIFDCLWMILIIVFAELYHKFTDFSLTTTIKRIINKGKVSNAEYMDDIRTIENAHEKRPEVTKADIVIEHLKKIWGATGEMAVRDMNLKASRGEVTVLLGHNGAGKSTTFSVICGLTPPTSGRVEVNKSSVGFCPQGNALFERLTVMEHLWFFSQLKGASNNWRDEGKQILESIGLLDKKNTNSMALSGGMKRKLCLAMSLIGDSKVILLDEPTAGMDIGARNDVQRMLDKEKRDRTILLTTHYMDEAEALGDRIIIMVKGRDVASGSTQFLERRFGSGYTLIAVFNENKTTERQAGDLLHEVKKYVQNATLARFHGKQVEINLPIEEQQNFPHLFSHLEASQQKLNVSSFGLSAANLEQVFLKVGELCEHSEDGAAARKALFDTELDDRVNIVASLPLQFLALLWKRVMYSVRNWSQWLYQVVLPMAMLFILAKFVDFNGIGETDGGVTTTGHALTLPNMGKMTFGISGGAEQRFAADIKAASNLKLNEDTAFPADALTRIPPFGGGVSLNESGSITFVVNPNSLWAPLTLLTSLANSHIQNDAGYITASVRIVSRLHHLDDQGKDEMSEVEDYYVSVIVILIFSMVTSPFGIYIVLERVTQFAHQQLLTRMPTLLLYATSTLYDAAIYFGVAGLTLWAFHVGGWDKGELLRVFYVMAVYFCAALPGIHLLCLLFSSPSKANTMILIIQSFGAFAFTVPILSIRMSSDWDPALLQDIFQALCPTYGLSRGVVMARMLGRARTGQYAGDPRHAHDLDRYHRSLWIMACNAAAYTLLYMVVRCPPLHILCARCCVTEPDALPENEDDLVRLERTAVENNADKYALNTNRLTKNYGKFTAVNRLTFGVRAGECFGLLGVNGAGKTTTFGILTGHLYPSKGSASINRRRIWGIRSMGYCPQFDAYIMELSCREVLVILATLYGYAHPYKKADSILRAVLMEKHAGKQLKHCSGGQKRKISVGISLLAQKHVILLDEPTAGIDPKARREIWSLVGAVRETEGRAVVLSSHSMDECEALCTRIGIMAHGQLRTIGSTQQIKSKYGNSYLMILIFDQSSIQSSSFYIDLTAKVQQHFPGTVYQEDVIQSNICKFSLPRKATDKWSEMWTRCSKLAAMTGAVDFSLAQASLTETFLNVTAEKQVTWGMNQPISVTQQTEINQSGPAAPETTDSWF